MEYDKKCATCGKRYKAKRSDSKTCSSTCRVTLSFVRKYTFFIGTIPLYFTESGKYSYYEVDLENLCKEVGIDANHLYLKFDDTKMVFNVYAFKQDNIK